MGAVAESPFDETLTESDIAGIFYTGGTTGAAKGVVLTQGNLLANTYHSQMLMPLDADACYLVRRPDLPRRRVDLGAQCIGLGARQVILEAFDPAVFLDLSSARASRPRWGCRPCWRPRSRSSRPDPGRVDAGPVRARGVARRPRDAAPGDVGFPGAQFVHLYGATETAPLLTGLIHEERLLGGPLQKSCGQPVVGVELVVRGPDGRPLPDGEPGEVTPGAPTSWPATGTSPSRPRRRSRDGWYWTGDIGRLDEDGYLYLLDRSKDMVVSGGENVYCTEVEDALYAHPMVLEATVFGDPRRPLGRGRPCRRRAPRGRVTVEELDRPTAGSASPATRCRAPSLQTSPCRSPVRARSSSASLRADW